MHAWRKIPVELWEIILQYAFDENGQWLCTLRASHVCHHWRQLLLSIPSLWRNVQIVEKDFEDQSVRGGIAMHILELLRRSNGRINMVKLLLANTDIPGVALRTLVDNHPLEKLVVWYTDTFPGPFFVPTPAKVVHASGSAERIEQQKIVILNDHFESIVLRNVMPYSPDIDPGMSNGLKHLDLSLSRKNGDVMTGYALSQCKDLETLRLQNVVFKGSIDITLNKLKKLYLDESSSFFNCANMPALETAIVYEEVLGEDELREPELSFGPFNLRYNQNTMPSLRYLKMHCSSEIYEYILNISDPEAIELHWEETAWDPYLEIDSINDLLSKVFRHGNNAHNFRALKVWYIPLTYLIFFISEAQSSGVRLEELYLAGPQGGYKPEEDYPEILNCLMDEIPKFRSLRASNYDIKDSHFPITF